MASTTSAISNVPTAADASIALDRQQAARVKKMTSAKTTDPKQADKVSGEFEAMFLSSMLQPVFAGLKGSKMFGGGHAEETWTAMLVDEYGKVMAKSGGLGIAKMVRDQILQLIDAEVQRLPTRQREAFVMRYWYEMDVAETATALGCSEGSVKTHCSRATHALAKALEAKGVTL